MKSESVMGSVILAVIAIVLNVLVLLNLTRGVAALEVIVTVLLALIVYTGFKKPITWRVVLLFYLINLVNMLLVVLLVGHQPTVLAAFVVSIIGALHAGYRTRKREPVEHVVELQSETEVREVQPEIVVIDDEPELEIETTTKTTRKRSRKKSSRKKPAKKKSTRKKASKKKAAKKKTTKRKTTRRRKK